MSLFIKQTFIFWLKLCIPGAPKIVDNSLFDSNFKHFILPFKLPTKFVCKMYFFTTVSS